MEFELPSVDNACMAKLHAPEEQFYSRYDWCLNPILSVRQLIHRFNEELDACRTSDGWQREECTINLYLFACAIACTADDYFNAPLVNFSPIYSRLPRLWLVLRPAEWAINSSALLLRIVSSRRSWRWRRHWNSRIEQVCDLLLTRTELPATLSSVPTAKLPERLLNWKM